MKKRHIKKGSVAILLIIIIAILFALLFCFKDIFTVNIDDAPVKLDKDSNINRSLSITMAGDVILNESILEDAMVEANKYDFGYIFEDLNINKGDLMLYNQESIIGTSEIKISGSPKYNSPVEIGDAMVDLGFNIVSLANIHSLDKGESGITNSVNYWEGKKVYNAGTYTSEENMKKENIREVNDIKYALLSYTTSTNVKMPLNKDYLVNIYSEKKVTDDINLIKDKVDLIIVSINWAGDYSKTPTESQKKIAGYLSGLGVNIVVGSNSSNIQPIELIDDTLVFYSLGNFLSGGNDSDYKTSLIPSFEIKISNKNEVSFGNIKADLLYTYSLQNRNYKIKSYSDLTIESLPTYKEMHEKYNQILTSLYEKVYLTKIGD